MGGGIGGDFDVAAIAAVAPPVAVIWPAKLVVPSDHTATVPPLPEPVALAFSVEAEVDRRRLGGRDVARAMEIAADPDGAAAGRAGGVDRGRRES